MMIWTWASLGSEYSFLIVSGQQQCSQPVDVINSAAVLNSIPLLCINAYISETHVLQLAPPSHSLHSQQSDQRALCFLHAVSWAAELLSDYSII